MVHTGGNRRGLMRARFPNQTAPPMFRRLNGLVVFVASACGMLPMAFAAPAPSMGASPRWTVYAGQLFANDLPPFMFDAVRGRLQTRDSYLLGGSWFQPTRTPDWLANAFSFPGMQSVTTGVEFIGLQHFRHQHDMEVDIAYMVHTPYTSWSGLLLRAGGGIGPSLALARPSAEDGPTDAPTRRTRLQNYIGLELEASLVDSPDIAMVLRLHHRSGAYGLVAPNGVGSNFLSAGLRFAF